MRLTSKARYGLIFLLHLARESESEFIGVYEVSDRQKISAHYLDQLARKFRIAGLVEPKKGPNGGYKLVKSPSEITLAEIMQAVGENIGFIDENIYLDGYSTDETRAKDLYLERFNRLVQNEFNKITLKMVKESNYETSAN